MKVSVEKGTADVNYLRQCAEGGNVLERSRAVAKLRRLVADPDYSPVVDLVKETLDMITVGKTVGTGTNWAVQKSREGVLWLSRGVASVGLSGSKRIESVALELLRYTGWKVEERDGTGMVLSYDPSRRPADLPEETEWDLAYRAENKPGW